MKKILVAAFAFLLLALPAAAQIAPNNGSVMAPNASASGGGGGAPSGPAGGDLSGSYPNPNVATYNGGSAFGTAASANTGTSGGTLCVLNTACTFSGSNAYGTPASITLTNGTGLPISGINGLGTGVATALAANLNGSGALTATTSPTFVTPTLGAATSTSEAIGGGSAITSSGPGGALGSNAFTSTAFLPLAGGTMSGNINMGSNGISAATTIAATGIISTSGAGTAANPEITVGNATTGLFSVSTTGFGIAVNGTSRADYGITTGSQWTLTGQVNSTSSFGLANSGGIFWSGRGILTSGAAGNINLGSNDAASPVAQILSVQNVVAGNANTAGAVTTFQSSLSNGSGTSDMVFKTTLASAASGTQNTGATALTLKGGTQGIQFNAATYASCTALTTDASGNVQCTASAMRFKVPLGTVAWGSAAHGLDLLHPAVWSYKEQYQSSFGTGVHVGLYADDVVKMDPRCAVLDADGLVKNYEDRCVTAHVVANIQHLESEIAELRARLH